jgi:HlyD family secretion protein
MQTLERPSTNGHVTSVKLETKRRRPRWLLAALASLVIVAIVASVLVVRMRAAAVTYTTVPVQTGSLAQTVTASGTLNPQNTISVGTQVSGTISQINVDFNSRVKKGQVLATLDPTTFQAALDQAKSTLAQSVAQAQATGATAGGGPSAVAQAQAQAQAAAATARAAQMTAAASQAAVKTAQTTVTKDQAALQLAQQTVARDRQLVSQGFIAQNTVDADQSALVAAQTALDGARAAVAQAQAQTSASVAQIAQANASAQALSAQTGVTGATAANQVATHDASVAAIGIQQAQVAQAQQNVNHTIITSPVDGTVISRVVAVGQTVAASLSTPTLFLIAQDLTKMELDLAVGEPDMGRVRPGDPVNFTVLAYPNRVFKAVVKQVRQNPTTVSNVVTYTNVVIVDNKDGALLPGMTANATIQVAHADNATIVPLAAFSYTPAAGSVAHRRRPAGANAGASSGAGQPSGAPGTGRGNAGGGGSPWGATTSSSSGAVTAGSTSRIFVERNGQLNAVPVKVGIVGDTSVAVTPLRGTLTTNDQVVIGDSRSTSSKGAANTNTRNLLTGNGGGGQRGGSGRGPGG